VLILLDKLYLKVSYKDQKILQSRFPAGPLPFLCRSKLLIISRIPLETFGHQFHDILYGLPGGVFSVGHQTSDHRLQGDGRVVAPEARQDVLNYRTAEPAAFGL
jgi:hypothetical protein